MDNKTWLWRKKSTEMTIVVADSVNLSLKRNEEEIQALLSDKVELEKELKNLNDKLTSAFFESNAKDELVQKHAKMTQEVVASLKKAEAESISLKQELDEALHQIVIGEERLAHLDAALKECMQQLRFVREDQATTVQPPHTDCAEASSSRTHASTPMQELMTQIAALQHRVESFERWQARHETSRQPSTIHSDSDSDN